jgi:hypothetical protein
MFSRLWYFVIAAIAGAGLAGAFIAQSTLDHRSELEVQDNLRRDRAELELWLRYDARARLDSLGPMAAHQDVRTALAAASGGRRGSLNAEARAGLGNTLASLNEQLEEGAAQLLFALDDDGTIVAQLGGTTPPVGAGLGAFPVVRRALSGFQTDDVLVYNGDVYRVAARPVVQGGRYVGAIVHCSEMGAQLAQRIGSRLSGATLGFFFRGDILATHSPDASVGRAEMETNLGAALELEELRENGHTAPVEMGEGRLALYAYATGSARHAGAGYILARPVPLMGSPMALFSSIPDSVMATMNWPLVAGLPLLLGLLGLLLMFLERDRPLSRFRTTITALGEGRVQHLEESALPARFRKLAHDVNEGLSRAGAGGAASPKATADLDQILGDAPSSSSTPYFGFAPEADVSTDAPPPPVLDGADLESIAPGPNDRPTPRPPPPPPPSFDDDDESGATRVAAVPSELLAASSHSHLDRHYRVVYDEFVALKKKCGEPTSGLTFDKLLTTLRKNAETIKAKHNVDEVRFTVYEKAGKAALKATPVKR